MGKTRKLIALYNYEWVLVSNFRDRVDNDLIKVKGRKVPRPTYPDVIRFAFDPQFNENYIQLDFNKIAKYLEAKKKRNEKE